MLATLLLLACVASFSVAMMAQSKSVELDPRVTALYAEAKAAQASGDRAGAIAKYESILKIAPRLGAAYNNLGALYFVQGDYPNAVAILEKGLKIDPKMSSAVALLGVALYKTDDYAAAREHLEAALRSHPTDDNAERFLANDLQKLGDFEGAAAHYQQLAIRHPQDQEVWYELGQIYMKLSEHALTRMNQIDPDSALTHEMSGEIMESMKNYDGALLEYKKAVDMAPQKPGPHYRLADAYWSLGQWEPAAEHFQAELANDPANCLAYWKLGNILIAQNQSPEKALADTEKALALCPTLVQARVDRARVLLKLGRNEEALSDLQAAKQAGQNDEPSVHFLLGQAYRALGRKQDATAEMQIFSKLEESARAATAQHAQEVIHNKDSTN